MGELWWVRWEYDAGAGDRGQAAAAEEFWDIEPGPALRSSFVRPSSRSWMPDSVIGGGSLEIRLRDGVCRPYFRRIW